MARKGSRGSTVRRRSASRRTSATRKHARPPRPRRVSDDARRRAESRPRRRKRTTKSARVRYLSDASPGQVVSSGVAFDPRKTLALSRVRRERPSVPRQYVDRRNYRVEDRRMACAKSKSVRRAVIIATGYGGVNGVRKYRDRKPC